MKVNSRKTKLNYLKRKWEKDITNKEKMLEYKNEVLLDKYFNAIFYAIAHDAGVMIGYDYEEYPEIIHWDCYKDLINLFEEKCMKLNTYALQYVRIFVHMCEDPRNYNRHAFLENLLQIYCPTL